MPIRRTMDEHTASGAIIHWGRPRPGPQRVWVTYPCCGQTMSRRCEALLALRAVARTFCRACCRREERAPRWSGTEVTPTIGRQRARSRYRDMGTCAGCGQVPATERHHRDGNPSNNARENVVFCCRRCHMVLDGRLYQKCKLTPEQARAIRTSQVSRAVLARQYGVSPSVIDKIRRRASYAWVLD